MAKNITRHVQHIKSVDTTTITVDGQDVVVAKLPEWGDLKDGEIAVNYNDGYETISIRNNNNEVVAFPNINTVNTLIDEKAQAALTFDSTPTANSTNPVTSDGIKTYVDNGDKIQSLTTYQSSTPLAVGDTHDQALSKLSKIIDDNEIITARALTDLNDTKQDEIDDLDEIRTGAALGATALQTETQLSKGTTTGNGNVVTDISVSDHQITLTKGATALTEHQSIKTVNGNTMVGTGDVSVGTITGITMNNVSKGTSGVVDLGTVITSETQLSKGTTSGDGNAVTDISVSDHQITLTKGATFLTEHQDLSAYADGAEYDSEEHLIYLKHGNTRLANPINAADFIKDGMVNSVRIDVLDDGSDSSDSSDDETRYLIVTFNTDAGLEDIEIPLSDIFDPSLYYTKEEIDEHELVTAAALTELHDTKADKIDYYTKDEVDELVDGNLDDYYTKQEVDEIVEEDELAISAALNDLNTNKQDKLEFDDEPTEDSSNPVTSDGIKTYVDTVAEEMALVTSAALNELNDTIEDIEVTIQNIQPELDFDDTPTAGSDNPVTSGGIKTYVDNAIGSLGNIVELNEPSVSTPLAVGDTYDQAFSKLTKIIRDNEFTTAGALTELYETKLEADDVYSKQEVDSMVEDKYAILNIDNFHEITDSGELNVNDVILNNCTNITDAKYITVIEPVNIGPSIQVQSYISDPRFYFVDYITISSGHSTNITLIFNRTITQNGITTIQTLTYTNSSLLLNDDGTSGTWHYNKETVTSKSMTEVTYSNLKTLRNNGELTPGSYYRITDYQCTTTQENTQSAGHQFDIVLLALSENKLAEEGWAMMNESNVYDVTYTPDVGQEPVTAKGYLYNYLSPEEPEYSIVLCDTLKGSSGLDGSEFTIDEENKTIVFNSDFYASMNVENLPYNYFQNSNLSAWKVWYCLDNDTSRFAWASVVDEDTTYYRWNRDGVYTGSEWDYYTLSASPQVGDEVFQLSDGAMVPAHAGIRCFISSVVTENNEITQIKFVDGRGVTITCDNENDSITLTAGKGVIYRMIDEFNNDIKYDFKNIQFKRTITDGQYDENGTDTWCYTLNVWYNNMCQDASIVGNTLPNDEDYVTGVYDNNFGYATAYDLYLDGVNTFAFALGDNVVLSFDDGSGYFGIYSNMIGNNFNANTIGNNFYSNTIEHGFNSNTIGNNFNYNTIGNYFMSNAIGDYFYSNTIGHGFNSNTIGTKNGNTITTINYVRYIRVEDGVEFVDITTSATTSSSNWLQNITIAQGVSGTFSSRKVITHATLNDTFRTTYQSANSQVVSV